MAFLDEMPVPLPDHRQQETALTQKRRLSRQDKPVTASASSGCKDGCREKTEIARAELPGQARDHQLHRACILTVGGAPPWGHCK